MSSRSATKRLTKELSTWENIESKDEKGVERLGPVGDDLLSWEAVINGRGVGCGYDEGRWLLRIVVPPEYPLKPPSMSFVTPIVHPNVALETGEICLDLLKNGWAGTYTVLECVRAVRHLLSMPGIDSPLNVDVAALLRDGDELGARRLVELWAEEEKYEGE
ncbi:hypothetical protein OQA88_3909 [Cercophora sp. LCS_1]